MRQTTIVDFSDLLSFASSKLNMSWNTIHDEIVKELYWPESSLVNVYAGDKYDNENVTKVIQGFCEQEGIKEFELHFGQ